MPRSNVVLISLANKARVSSLEGLEGLEGHTDRNWEPRKQWAQPQAPGDSQCAGVRGPGIQEDATQKVLEYLGRWGQGSTSTFVGVPVYPVH